ncbi:Uu.00g106860.m01.CDS01 [Anthostomella pinea]|uniref:Uu.00g106860.m01.CDS01 n=1 Tax=Anthostomella pinea TaxID=933095 RepID=A0AAI8VF80_9PEZI|nr:Uu.00g106860.m01.CDS01 [Anthostomella pinea]
MSTRAAIPQSQGVGDEGDGGVEGNSYELAHISGCPQSSSAQELSTALPPVEEEVNQAQPVAEASISPPDDPPTQPPINAETAFSAVYQAARKFGKERAELIIRVIAVLAFFIAVVTLWPTIAAAYDGREARLMAEWEAHKDFIEFCETVRSHRCFFRLALSGSFD